MRYLKMLGLAAVAAMALTAFLGASSASATVLCKTTSLTTGCHSSGWAWPKGTTIHAVLEEGTHATLNGLWADVTCKKSTVHGSTSNTGSATETVKGPIEALTFEECTCGGEAATVKVIEKGELEVHHRTEGKKATMTGRGTLTTIECAGLKCRFGSGTGIDLGEMGTASGTDMATMDANATVLWSAGDGDNGSFLCGSTAKWEAKYTVTEPEPLIVSES